MTIKNYQKKFLQSYQLRSEVTGKYIARCDGEAVYLYNADDYQELACFRDLNYVNQIKFSDDGRILVLKSIEPELAVYDISEMKLICHIKVENTSQAQDGKFCLAPDNQYIYNIVYFNDLSSAIARIDVKKQSYQIIFHFENCLFEEAEYLSHRDIYLFSGKDRTVNKYFVLEYGVKGDKFRRVTLNREYRFFFSLSAIEAFVAVAANKIYILAADYITPLRVFTPIDDKTTKLNFFNIITESPALHKIFHKNEEEYARLKIDTERNMLDVPVEGDIVALAFSYNMKYLLVATNNVLKIYDYQKLRLLQQIKLYNIADINFGFDDKTVLVGTWNYGYIYNLIDLVK
ncbi:MAG: hypothetical protein M0R05_01925 [Bacilli bacterium]|nr:hypothetical protein [Bacilli bacterium]MDD4387962.1 hypothetical protein [Bacilli bacterium]